MAINNLNINIVQHFAKSRTIFLFNTKQHFSFKVQFLHILNTLHILKHSLRKNKMTIHVLTTQLMKEMARVMGFK